MLMISRPKRMRVGVVYAVLIVLLAVAVWVDINAGYRHISLETLGQIVLGKGEAGARYTLLHLRLPRVLTSLLVGVGLAVAGCILQGVSRNEMAEPGLLGINAGAGLFVAAFIVFFAKSSVSTSFLLPLLAFAGSVCAALIDYRLALTARGLSPRRLLLIGIAMSTAISSLTTVLMLLVGLSLLSAFLFYKSRTLNVISLGHQIATGLGVAVSRQTVVLLAAAVAMSSLCCAVGGGLSFVGLVCPHLARRLVGPDFRVLLGATLLTGALLMTFSDILSRTLLAPNEISIGIVAAVIGAPYFLYLLVKS